MPTERVRVVCSCGWAGRRAEAGGPCPRCDSPVSLGRRNAPYPKRGRRVRRVVYLETHESEALPTAADLARAIAHYVKLDVP